MIVGWRSRFFICFLLTAMASFAGRRPDEMRQDSLVDVLLAAPSFGIYKENYFLTGINRMERFSSVNCNVKYQISLWKRLTRSVLPFRSYLFMTYTQKSFWNIYQKSCPFEDNNYNPALGLGRFVLDGDRVRAQMAFVFDHESNGADGRKSRSWNRFAYHVMIPTSVNGNLQVQLWIPWAMSVYNENYDCYRGFGNVTYNLRTDNHCLWFSLSTSFCPIWNRQYNLQLDAACRLPFFENVYFLLQFYCGYAEQMLMYDHFRHSVRIGVSYKPPFFSLY
ncbi:MAG: phospholipase A [Paludibacteraceae bacterium]